MSLLGQGVTALSQHTEPGSCVTHPVHTGAGRDFVSDLNPSPPQHAGQGEDTRMPAIVVTRMCQNKVLPALRDPHGRQGWSC